MANLNKINYVDQDFATASTQIRAFLATNFPNEFNDYAASNIGIAFIDIIAWAEQNLSWYINRRVTDLYFPTAVTPRSISKIARMLGYKARPATAARVAVSLSFPDAPYAFPVVINSGFQWQGPNNSVWQYRGEGPLVLQPGVNALSSVELAQGENAVANFVSNGRTRQAFELLAVPTGRFVEKDSVKVTVDGEEWTEHPIIPFTNDNNFETNLLAFPPVVRFGDGVQGNIPTEGAGIEITYTITDGFRGRIVSQSIGDPVVGLVAQFEDIKVLVNQPMSSVGGDDPEDTRSITVNAPKFQRVQDRAITKDDYDFLANQFENVSKADAQIVRGMEGDATILLLTASIQDSVTEAVDGLELDELFDDMTEATESLEAEVDAFTDTLTAAILPSITTAKTQLTSLQANMTSAAQGLASDSAPIISLVTDAKSAITTETLQAADDLQTIFDVKNVSIESFLTAILAAVASTAAEATVTAQVTNVRSKITEMKSAITSRANLLSSTIGTQAEVIESNTGLLTALIGMLPTDLTAATAVNALAIVTAVDAIPLALDAASSDYGDAVEGHVTAIKTAASSASAAIVSGTSGLKASVDTDIAALKEHLNTHLTDSCNANEVQIKVLGKDANRKYVAPLQSTLDGLKAYLDARKDIVHTISCVAGTVDVVNADVEITAKISENAVEDDVIAAIKDALDKSDVQPFGILVERPFNRSLYIWEIDGAIRAKVSSQQIDYLNVKITGPAEYLDAAGNLVIPTGKVVQAGNISVTAFARFLT